MPPPKKAVTFIARNGANSSLINFVALVSGMVTTLFVALSIWNYFTASQKVDRVLAASEVETASGESAATRIGTREFDQVLANGSADQLEPLLIRLNNWDRSAELSIRVHENLNRAKVANKMLTMPLTTSQRNMAIESEIAALSAIYGLDLLNNLKIPDVGANLLAAAETHLSDPNREIARTASMAVAKVETYEFIKSVGPESDPQIIVSHLLGVLHQYPDDEFVLRNTKLILFSLIGFDHNLGLTIMRGISKQEKDFTSTREVRFFNELHDRIMITESDFERLLNDRWVNGSAGQRELLKTAMALAADTTGALELMRMVDSAADWFEQIKNLEAARKIYQVLFDSSAARKNPELISLAKQLGESGMQRCDLVGNKMAFGGSLTLGGELDPTTYSDQVLVILFWSASDRKSVETINKLNDFAQSLTFKKAAVLAVCVDVKREQVHLDLAQKNRGFVFVDYTDKTYSGPSIKAQCPVSRVPQIVLVNHLGIVTEINVPTDELDATAEFLLIKQFENH